MRVNSILYGVTSMPFFLTRLRHFLESTRQRHEVGLHLDIISAYGAGHQQPGQHGLGLHHRYLPQAHEVYFLELFWQTYYFSFPILNEGRFRGEYKALWADAAPGAPRKASPLMDIVLALCIQLGSFVIRPDSQGQDRAEGSDLGSDGSVSQSKPPLEPSTSCAAPLAGFHYYQRCQDAIDKTIESPSITTVQCYIFTIVYLCEAGLLNRAQVVAGKAIMMAILLGLPNEPLSSDPEPEKEVARRTWWSLYILDTKLSMEIGRPPIISPEHSTCHPPSDSSEVALWLGPHYSFDETCPTWLGFQTQTLRLHNAVRTARAVLYTKYDAVVGHNGYADFVTNSAAREECALLLTEQMKELSAWAGQLPWGYIVPRTRGGRPYSTDRSPLDLKPDVLIHCQRQRLLLELQYHQYCMSLCQPFICLAPRSPDDAPTPVSDSRAAVALDHATTLTSMIHQALTSSEALSGIYHVLRWQTNALFTMLGFAYAFPVGGSAAAARRAVQTAIAVVDMYRDLVPEARPAAHITRVLAEDVATVVSGLHPTTATATATATAATAISAENSNKGGGGSSSSSWPPAPSMVLGSAAATVVATATSLAAADTMMPPTRTETKQTTSHIYPDHDRHKSDQLRQDVAMPMVPPVAVPAADKMLDLSFLDYLEEDSHGGGYSMETTASVQTLWASLEPGSGVVGPSGADLWGSVIGGDVDASLQDDPSARAR